MGTKREVRTHLMSLVDDWSEIYENLVADFKDDGVPLAAIPIELLLAGDLLAKPPTGLGYGAGSLRAFLNAYINSAAGRRRYKLRADVKITASMISALSDAPKVATLVRVIDGLQ